MEGDPSTGKRINKVHMESVSARKRADRFRVDCRGYIISRLLPPLNIYCLLSAVYSTLYRPEPYSQKRKKQKPNFRFFPRTVSVIRVISFIGLVSCSWSSRSIHCSFPLHLLPGLSNSVITFFASVVGAKCRTSADYAFRSVCLVRRFEGDYHAARGARHYELWLGG